MIQAIRETDFTAYISTKENRIGSQTTAQTRHLVKFINDLDGKVFYAYPKTETIYDRYTKMEFEYSGAVNRYAGKINLIPSGYFKYEVYEVSWAGAEIAVSKGIAPATETDVFVPAADELGVVEGLVEIGKLYLSDIAKPAGDEVQYIQNAKRVQTLTIASGGSGYATAPTVTIAAPTLNGGTTATATCTVSGGVVNTVTITAPGSGYETNPVVTLAGGGFTVPATITASVEETNYIYYGQ
jgi:hypothetical protein